MDDDELALFCPLLVRFGLAHGVDYEIVTHGYIRSAKGRAEVVKLSGQKSVLPVLELPDGTVYREETDDMIAKLKAGELDPA